MFDLHCVMFGQREYYTVSQVNAYIVRLYVIEKGSYLLLYFYLSWFYCFFRLYVQWDISLQQKQKA